MTDSSDQRDAEDEWTWRCVGCGLVYGTKPEVCSDCGTRTFEPLSDDLDDENVDAWQCGGCEIVYDTEPMLCTDCGSDTFVPVADDPASGGVRTATGPQSSIKSEHATAEQSGEPDDLNLHSRRWRVLYAVAILAVVTVGAAIFTGVLSPGLFSPSPCADLEPASGADATIDRTYVECTVHDLAIDERVEEGYDELSFDAGLREDARQLAETMARNGYEPEDADENVDTDDHFQACANDGQTDWTLYQQLPYDTPFERDDSSPTTLETNDELARGILNNHLRDPDSRAILTTGGFQKHAVGIYVTSDDQVYVVQHYC